MSRIFVRNVPTKIKESEVQSLFSKCGKITDTILKTNFAFIQYETKSEAIDAIKLYNNYSLYGNKLNVELAKSRSEKLAERSNEKCFQCGEYGHWAKDCKPMRRYNRKEKKFKKIRASPTRSFSNSYSRSPSRSRSRSQSMSN